MKTVHIYALGHEFIGETDNEASDKEIILKKAVKCLYMQTPKGLLMHLKNLQDDNDSYGEIIISNKTGTIIMVIYLKTIEGV